MKVSHVYFLFFQQLETFLLVVDAGVAIYRMEPANSNINLSLLLNDDSFQEKINQFYSFIQEVTLQDMEATNEERRQIMAG